MYELVADRVARSDRELVPPAVLDRPPSAALRPPMVISRPSHFASALSSARTNGSPAETAMPASATTRA